jgi:uncharacterized membrane protein YjgN (DUF898 family)
MFCPVCHLEYGEGFTTCGNCGVDLVHELPLPQNPDTARPARILPVEFTGSAREYFRIWIVNLCLTLLTVGIFSAWAKVRKKRYYYSHTILDGTPFQYLGRPLPILKGRVIATIAFSAYYLSNFFNAMLPYVIVGGVVLAPWVLIRSAAFNARYSSFRNMTFRFDGKYLAALKAIYALGIVPGLLVVAAMVFEWRGQYAAALIAAAAVIFGLSFPWWMKQVKGFLIGHASYGGREGKLSATGGQFFRVYFTAILILLSIGVISTIILAAAVFLLKSAPTIMVFLAVIPIYAGYVLSYAYIKARGTNLVWDHTQLGPVRFKSSLTAGGLAKLYLTNALAIIASLGTLTPWAVMRTLRYRADNLLVLVEGNLADFQGSEKDTVQAAGAEIGDFFDMDLSL